MAYTSLSGSKLRSKMGSSLNESAALHTPLLLSAQSSFAKRQLVKMGWTEGTGLGRQRNGIVDHVKIKRREEEAGLGSQSREKELKSADDWWKDSAGGTLARLQKKKKKKTADDAVEAKTFTDQELFQATGGARFGMRAQRRAEGKWKRTESGQELADMEERARASMEWNGRGDAKVLILSDDGKQKKRKRSKLHEGNVSDEQATREDESESEKKRLKRLRKEAKKKSKSLHKVSPPASEEEDAPVIPVDDDAAATDADDRAVDIEKKDKKKKKKSKKSSCK
jgi:Pin2-interacting protein X1